MSLGDEQRKFTYYVGKLIAYAYENGYELTFGDAWAVNFTELIKFLSKIKKLILFKEVQKWCAKWVTLLSGRKHSNLSFHYERLAVDFNLFRNGEYLDKTEDHRILGEYWESLHEKCTWGGRWNDGNHYSWGEGI